MIWLNPWAWIGASAIALPILIHLLGRGHARAHHFPTLRFLEASRLLPTRRTRIHDLLLLIVRCALIVFAAAALARPLLLTRERARSLDRGVARAIVVDTSASMKRLTPSGTIALDSARQLAHAMTADAATNVVVESADPSHAVASASAWLAKQGRRGELVVISDFQRGAIDSSDFAGLGKEIGISVRRIPVAAAIVDSRATSNGLDVAARAAIVGDRTDAEWTPRTIAAPNDAVVLMGADSERDAIRATEEAARSVAVPLPVDSARATAIVFAKYPDAAKVKSTATFAYQRWMVDLLRALRRDSIAVASTGVANVGGRSRLVLFTEVEAGSLGSARLVAAANRATSVATPATELDPETLSDEELAAMRRPASDGIVSPSQPRGDNSSSDARWLWLAMLVLLGIETILRRRQPVSTTSLGETSTPKPAASAPAAERARAG